MRERGAWAVVSEVCRFFGMERETVMREIEVGALPVTMVPSAKRLNARLFLRDVHAWALTRTAKPGPALRSFTAFAEEFERTARKRPATPEAGAGDAGAEARREAD